MSNAEWLILIFVSGLAGAMGQSVRMLVGLKKLDDQATLEDKCRNDLLSVSRIMISVVIGFTAGVLAALSVMDTNKALSMTKELFFSFMAAGYTGTDFIEGMMSKFIPSTQTNNEKVNTPLAGRTIDQAQQVYTSNGGNDAEG